MVYRNLKDLQTKEDVEKELEKLNNDSDANPLLRQLRLRGIAKRYDEITGGTLYEDVFN